ncbi:hypothetical protein HanRHA438_Chr03g0147471 [Helianthus annuus]|nr:hypothetical protein HanRHA438_Chr03g0147471 [Helianthus annuus]
MIWGFWAGMWWWRFGQGCGGGGGGGGGGRDVVVVVVVAGMWWWWWWKKRSAKKRFQEDMESRLCGEEVSQTFFNERSARKQTSCGLQTSARVCPAQT